MYKEKGLTENRRETILNFTNGRTENSADLSTSEIKLLISTIEGNQKHNDTESKTIKKLFSLCYLYGWKVYNEVKGKYTVDMNKLNGWLIKYGKYHKSLQDHTPGELGIITAQFEIVVNRFLKSI